MRLSHQYQSTLDFLYAQLPMYQREGLSAFKKDLKNIYLLLDYLDNPHNDLRIIHIAGTNGKGSTTHLIASILQEMGYRVGCYTSPHYKDFRERIKINVEFVPEQYVIDFVDRIKPILSDVPASFFELTVAMAFDYFRTQSPDYCIIETGLGGRLDSTNVVDPLMSIITNISLDHQHMLGDTLVEIAAEKAGIIKEGKPVLIGERQKSVEDVFLSKAKLSNSELFLAEELVVLKEDGVIMSDIELKLQHNQPLYFKKNIRTSLAAIENLEKYGHINKPTIDQLQMGVDKVVSNTYYIGRNMILGNNPLILADSGHNQAGVEALFDYVASLDHHRLHIICGFVNDKKLEDIISYFPKDASYYFAKANVPRAMDAVLLKDHFSKGNRVGRAYDSSVIALEIAKIEADETDLIVICGSIFLVAELI